MDDAAMRYLYFSDNWNVVFRLAGDHASIAAGAHIQVDAHSPRVWRVQRRMRVETRRGMWQFFCAWNLFRKIVILTILFQCSFTNKTAAFDAEMFLCDRERVTAADFGHLHGLNSRRTGDRNMRIGRRSQKVSVEPGLLRKSRLFLKVPTCIRKLDKLRHFAPPTQRNRDGVVGMPRGQA